MNKLRFDFRAMLLLVMILTFSTNTSLAQSSSKSTTTVEGRVIDKIGGNSLTGATVVVKGTYYGGVTDVDGEFKVSIQDGTKNVVLVVTLMGYESTEIDYIVSETNGRLKEDIILAIDNLVILDEVKVVGDATTAIMKGDTIQFNAGAFKTNPDATAEDLLAKMPGFEVTDGKVTAQGEDIARVYVDGKSFYKNDPIAALNALPADFVGSIELFDEKSKKSNFTGADDGTRIKTINIVTKAKNSDMKMGDFIAGYGAEDKYSGRATINIFEGNNRFSIGLGSNNINQSALSGNRYYGRHGIQGIQENTGLKLNYSGEYAKENGDETSIGASYIFDRKNSAVTSEKLQQSLFNNEIYDVSTGSNSLNDSHSFNLDLESTFGTNMIIFEPFATISESSSTSFNNTERSVDNITTNQSSTNNNNSSDSYSVGGMLEWMKRLGDKSSIVIGADIEYSKSNSDKILMGNSTQYDYDLETMVDSLINQKTDIFTGNNSATGLINYTYNLKEGQNIDLEYELSHNWSDSNNKVYLFDTATNGYTDLYENLSNVFDRDYLKNTAGIGYSATKKDVYDFNFGADYQHSALQNDLIFPENESYDYTFNSLKLRSSLEYHIGESKRISLYYKGSPNLPSVNQLQDVVNNNNPLMVSKGNPNLEQSFTNSLSVRYFSSNIAKSTNISFFSNVRQESNSFANSIVKIKADTLVNGVPVQAGAQLSSTVNLGNKISAIAGLHYSFPIKAISSKMNIGGIYRYSHTPSLYNNVLSYTNNNYFNTRMSINSNISENVDFTISNMLSYTLANNSNNSATSNEYITEQVSASANWIFLKNFVFNTSYSYNYNYYIDNGVTAPQEDNHFHLLNAGIGYKFMDRNAEIRISGYDLLNQSQSISRSVGDQFVTDNVTNVLQRYYMVTLAFKFNTMKNAMPKVDRENREYGPASGRGPGGGGHGGGGRRH